MANPFEKLLRAGEGRLRRKLQRVVNAVNDLEESYEKLSDEDLRNETTVRVDERRSPPCARPPGARSACAPTTCR